MRWATPEAAADTRSMAGSTGCRAPADTTTWSAKAPNSVEPITRSPTARPSTPGPSEATVPANSLPTVNGTGMVIWYLSATTRTSGKLAAAAATSTTT